MKVEKHSTPATQNGIDSGDKPLFCYLCGFETPWTFDSISADEEENMILWSNQNSAGESGALTKTHGSGASRRAINMLPSRPLARMAL